MEIKKLTLTIDNFDHDTMADDSEGVVSTILRCLAKSIDEVGFPLQDEKILRDPNGNSVGEISVDWEE